MVISLERGAGRTIKVEKRRRRKMEIRREKGGRREGGQEVKKEETDEGAAEGRREEEDNEKVQRRTVRPIMDTIAPPAEHTEASQFVGPRFFGDELASRHNRTPNLFHCFQCEKRGVFAH